MAAQHQAHYEYQPKRSSPLGPAYGYPSPPPSRVQTIDSQMQDTASDISSPPQSYMDTVSEQDTDAGAMVPHRFQEPQSPEPQVASPAYPQRQQQPAPPVNPYAGAAFNAPPLQHRGTASSGNFPLPSHTNSWASYAASNSSQRSGHKYGNVKIKGQGRVIQGNAYDGQAPPAWMRDHEYGDVEIDGQGSMMKGDVPTSVLPRFWDFNNDQSQQRVHQGGTPMPRR
ncbi:hypothetical protein H2198_010251 [Neophaeococcomyces mojaviensis]|uniref:Uncharacterized protein n=1 Tax=Neophaeococcomyces mojaviensis TaxID=3383035 RepID=A0ACC2ZS73_9EURO|nr:hypothetical protein H2198_010251 [Knufia sp. JES_112]